MNGFTGLDSSMIGGMSSMSGMGGFGGMGGFSGVTSQSQVLYQLQSILQLQLFKNFSTGNFFIDTLAQLFLMTLITYLFTQIKTLLDKAGLMISWIFYKSIDLVKWSYSKILNTPIKQVKNVDIPYISDNRKINELYKAVSWYLSTNSEIDYTKETDLQYVYEKPIVPENIHYIKSNLALNKIMSQNKKKEIKFKNYIIKYELGTELVTIYTDREKKRENYKVKLWVEIDQFVKSDILEEFCQLCITKYLDSLTSNTWKQQIFINKEDKWVGENSNNTRKLDTIILQNSLKEEIRDDFMRFINSEDWYNSLDIPFNRGYLFYGRPGTGKTSLIRGLSLHFKRHIHFLMLQNIKSDVELLDLFRGINYKETILVIEDIDAMVSAVKSRDSVKNKNSNSDSDSDSDSDTESDSDSKSNKTKTDKKLKKLMRKLERQNKELEKQNKQIDTPGYKKRDVGYDLNSNDKEKKSGITLSGLLNAIDGVVSSPGRILIMTTNHPEVLDDALVRPGRCDAKYQFDFCNKEQIKELFQMFFNTEAPAQQLANIKASEYSPAHITSVFLRYRNEHHKALEHLDDLEQKVTIKPLVENNLENDSNKNNFNSTNANSIKDNVKIQNILRTLPNINKNNNFISKEIYNINNNYQIVNDIDNDVNEEAKLKEEYFQDNNICVN
jgi:ATP-dependent 26S proteasome regulatory subunit